MSMLGKQWLGITILALAALSSTIHAQGTQSASAFFNYYDPDDYYEGYESSLGIEQDVTLDIDDDLSIYAFTDVYPYDEADYDYAGLDLSAEIDLFEDGVYITGSIGYYNGYAELYETAEAGHTYEADGIAFISGDGDWQNLGYLPVSVSTYDTPSSPWVNSMNPSYGSIGTSNQPITFYGYDLLNSDGSLPTYSSSDSNLTFTFGNSQATGAASTQSTLYGTYSIASGDSPTGALIDLYNDGGVSNDVTFTTGYPDASNISITPSSWPAGQTTSITITGTNIGTAPTAYVTPFDITYNQGSVSSGTISATVTVPSTETATQALVYVTPGNTGCSGSCYVSSDPGNSTGQAMPGTAQITPAPAISCTTNVTRGQTVTCTGTNGSSFTNWTFTDGTNTVGPTSGTTATTWSGTAAVSGTVSAQANGVTASAQMTVAPRTGWAFAAASATQQTNPYTPSSTSSCASIYPLSVNNPPLAPPAGTTVTDEGPYRLGLSGLCQSSSYTYQTITGGPNNGYTFVASATNSTQFDWVGAQDILNPASVFYGMQCGNYNPTTNEGFISGANLSLNLIRHESSSTPSQGHYGNYVASQNSTSLNVGTAYEQIVVFGNSTALGTSVNGTTGPNQSAINAAAQVEPPQSQYDGSGTYLGNINYPPSYATCP